MKLKKVQNSSVRYSEPALSISKAGAFSFNKQAAEDLGLIGKSIDIYQDEENPDSWYLNISDQGDIKLRENDGRAMGNSSSIAREIKISTKNDPDKGLTALIGKVFEENEMILYPLLIRKGTAITR